MKKIIPLVIVGILVFSGLGAATNQLATNTNDEAAETTNISTFQLELSQPVFKQEGEFTTVELEQTDTFLSHSGKPMLPVITKTFAFPLGTRIDSVDVNIDWDQYDLDRKVTPTPVFVPQSLEVDPVWFEEQRIDETVYESADLYPAEPYTIRMGAGLEDNEHVVFVNVKCYSQYSPANDFVNIPTDINIDIEYENGELPAASAEQYDLIIVTHELFEDEMQPLVAHKESLGITTKLVTVQEIYDEYEGVGDWEEIKMYLADHVVEWDTIYVLLAGGHKGQTHEWYVPDFRSHCWDPADAYDPPYDETFSSDLYFADLYRVNAYGFPEFENWDPNGNGIYAEGPDMPSGVDNMDFYPDVHLGRLPFRYEWEASVAVDKIINYENTADDSWFKKAVLAGGDGFPPERYGPIADPDLWEGEIVCDVWADLLELRGVESTKAYCSDQGDIQVRKAEDVYNLVNDGGAGFCHYTGHANPFSLGSYEPGTGITDPEPPLTDFYRFLNLIQYDNEYELPFFVCEGCHNAQFDVTGQDLIDYVVGASPEFLFLRFEWIPHDSSSWLILQEGGGGIGLIGNTALGLGGLNDGITEFVGGWIMIRFCEAWAVEEIDYTGAIWTYGINGYIDNFDVGKDTGDRKTIEERVLLGDPSVRLGGYKSSLSEEDTHESEVTYGPVQASVPTWSVGDSWTYALDNIDIDLTAIEGRAVTLQLSAGDIVLEVIDETSSSYVTSLKSDNIDVTFGASIDFYAPGVDNIEIPTIHLDNIQIDAEMTIDKENLGIKEVDLGLIFEIMENLDNIEDILGMEFPAIVDTLAQYISIPANIDLNIEFDNAFELLQFPMEQETIWGIEENTLTLTIDGSVESVWLRILDLVNKIFPILPAEIAQYLPTIDISDVLEDFGIASTYEVDIPKLGPGLFPYHTDTTPLFEVLGTQSVNVQAGQYNAAKVSVLELNGEVFYAENARNIVKITGHLGDYVPIITDINLELKE